MTQLTWSCRFLGADGKHRIWELAVTCALGPDIVTVMRRFATQDNELTILQIAIGKSQQVIDTYLLGVKQGSKPNDS